ncbi:hypothetical protein D046_8503, partial [Vibrio parahaemolyticus V-223/04]
MCLMPYQSATRIIVPRLPGSETPSRAIIKPFACGSFTFGISTTAMAALLLTS